MTRGITVALVVVALGGSAHADRAEALRLFDEGRALLADGKVDVACDRFERSFQIERAAGTALNLGDCAVREGDVRRAWYLYMAAEQQFARSDQSGRARFARERADELVARHPGLGKLRPIEQDAVPARAEPVAPAAAPPVPATAPTPAGPPPAATVHASTRPAPAHATGRDDTSGTRPWSRRTKLLVAGGATLGVSLLAGAYWIHAYTGPIHTYQDLLDRREGALGASGEELDSEDCGKATVPGDPHAGDFRAACTASSRMKYVMPLTIGAGIVGAAIVIYAVASTESTPRRAFAIAPAIAPNAAGATLRLDW